MEAKTSLEMYRTEKVDIRKGNFYNNMKDRAVLFEASEGCLITTKSFVGKYTQNDGVCVVCGKERETMRYIMLEWECIHPKLQRRKYRASRRPAI